MSEVQYSDEQIIQYFDFVLGQKCSEEIRAAIETLACKQTIVRDSRSASSFHGGKTADGGTFFESRTPGGIHGGYVPAGGLGEVDAFEASIHGGKTAEGATFHEERTPEGIHGSYVPAGGSQKAIILDLNSDRIITSISLG